jgi:pimeloyl-ACP methyl ester carboxylesterase
MIRQLMASMAAAVVAAGVVAIGSDSPVAADSSPQYQCAGSLGTKKPVLLVHGYNGTADAWKNSYKEFCDSNTWATTFNYGDPLAGSADPSLHWVTDPQVGPALADKIAELADESATNGGPGKVIVIAHSMGGLALRCALVDSCNGHQGDLTTKVGAAVTFDTPNIGSFLRGNGSAAENALVDILTETVSLGCFAGEIAIGGPAAFVEWLMHVCSYLSGMLTGPAATAFTPGSPELGRSYGHGTLPPLAGEFPLTAVGGSIRLKTTIFYHDLTLGDVGDLVVGEDSAFAAANRAGAIKQTIDCGTLNLSGLDQLLPVVGTSTHAINGTKIVLPSCWHGPEPDTTKFVQAARDAVKAYENSTTTQPVTLTTLKNAPVPALRGNPAGTLRNGELPNAIPGGSVSLYSAGGGEDPTYGDVTGDGVADGAAVIEATSGAGGGDEYVELYTNGAHPRRLGGYDPVTADPRSIHARILAMTIGGGDVLLDWQDYGMDSSRHMSYWSAHLHWDGHSLQLTNLVPHTGVTRSDLWSDPKLLITTSSLGRVHVGMTYEQAERASGFTFGVGGDGYVYPDDLLPNHLYVSAAKGYSDVRCLGAQGDSSHGQVIVTPEGFTLGGSVASLKAIYGTRARYVPPPRFGMTSYAGYVVQEDGGALVFMTDHTQTTVTGVAGGPAGMTPNSCTG